MGERREGINKQAIEDAVDGCHMCLDCSSQFALYAVKVPSPEIRLSTVSTIAVVGLDRSRFLLQARLQSGVEDLDGVDTLLLHLLADLRAEAETEVHNQFTVDLTLLLHSCHHQVF